MAAADPPDTPPAVTAAGLLAALKAAGFTIYHEVPGSHARMQWPADARPEPVSIVVPLDDTQPNHRAALTAILVGLSKAAAAGLAAQDALARIYARET